MPKISRRDFMKLTAGAAITGFDSYGCTTTEELTSPSIDTAKDTASVTSENVKNALGGGGHVVVVGGGVGGATAAKYIRKIDPSINVTLINERAEHTTCSMSNWVLAGIRNIASLTHNYETLAGKYAINVVIDRVIEIDATAKTIKTRGGQSIAYDRCIVSPGIAFRWDTIEGYDEAASRRVPHAWIAGPQTMLLHKQLEAMPNGGTFVLSAPPNPYRCPAGPYERASLAAAYLKANKPKSKVLILDSKDKFDKQSLFTAGWEKLYPGMIEWRSQADDGTVIKVDVDKRVVKTEFDEVKADVLNIIPAQKAGSIAHATGLADDTGWCPVDYKTWESTLRPGIHVIGDSAIQAPMPKSAHAANSEAKACAAAIIALLNEQELVSPTWVNTCYSLVGPDYGISTATVYHLMADGKVGEVEGSGGSTPLNGNYALEAVYAKSWYNNITDDIFG